MPPVASTATAPQRFAIIAGNGRLPLVLAERAAVAPDRAVHIIGIAGEADPEIARYPHSWIKWGELGRLFRVLEAENMTDLVIVGGVTRPDLANVRLDFGAITNLPFILGLMQQGGDDGVLGSLVRFFEGRGYRVRGVHEVAPDLIARSGGLTRLLPDDQDLSDIAKARAVLASLGPHDVGQCVAVDRNRVLAIEAAEGTDRMLNRVVEISHWGTRGRGRRRGVAVKSAKPDQELRVDMPAIGPRTVELVAEAGLKGLAIEAGRVLVIDEERVRALADAADVFVFGF